MLFRNGRNCHWSTLFQWITSNLQFLPWVLLELEWKLMTRNGLGPVPFFFFGVLFFVLRVSQNLGPCMWLALASQRTCVLGYRLLQNM